jgi:hypothetical protein
MVVKGKGEIEMITTRVLFKGRIWRVTGKTASELDQMRNKNFQTIVTIYNRHKGVENVSLGEIMIVPPFANGEKQYNHREKPKT